GCSSGWRRRWCEPQTSTRFPACGRGNYSMGLKEHIVFPEIEYDKIDQIWGMDIIFTTTAPSDAEGKALLKAFNMPFAD
ncbi:MAG: hypothetical protein AAFU61_08415, partial [Pseudomonadota bacterium]